MRIYSIEFGQDFQQTLAETVMQGLAPMCTARPEGIPITIDLARWTFLVPTNRAAKSLRAAFINAAPRRSTALPSILTLGDLQSDDESEVSDVHTDDELTPPSVVNSTHRLLILSRLVHAIRSVDDYQTIDQSIALAQSLSQLFDTFEISEADWSQISELAPNHFADYWNKTLTFLKIVSQAWPQYLQDNNLVDHIQARKQQVLRWSEKISGEQLTAPIVVAGSTGSVPSTARLITAVAGNPAGWVILPGLDRTITDDQASTLGPDHPQYGMIHLLKQLGGLLPHSVLPYPNQQISSSILKRIDTLHTALLPPENTHQWRGWIESNQSCKHDIYEAFSSVAIAEARNEHEEVLTIVEAVCDSLKDPQVRAMVITPDRNIAAAVVNQLSWRGIYAHDSGGSPYTKTPAGTYLLLCLEAASTNFAAIPLIALLRHRWTRLNADYCDSNSDNVVSDNTVESDIGHSVDHHIDRRIDLRLINQFERDILRGAPLAAGISGLRRAIGNFASDPRAKSKAAQRYMMLVNTVERAFMPLSEVRQDQTLSLTDWVIRHLQVVINLTKDAATDEPDKLPSPPQSPHEGESKASVQYDIEVIIHLLQHSSIQFSESDNAIWRYMVSLVKGNEGQKRHEGHENTERDESIEGIENVERVEHIKDADNSEDTDNSADVGVANLLGFNLSIRSYEEVIGELLSLKTHFPHAFTQSRVQIYGTLEARLLSADFTVIAGCNERTWPRQPSANPWMNSAMLQSLGITLSARRIGLAAHDFVQAVCGKRVLITRALQENDRPSTPSRWLTRLRTLLLGLDPQIEANLTDVTYLPRVLNKQRAIVKRPRASRPAPKPPVQARPRSLSVSAIDQLVRDPYAIYAQRILKLRSLRAINDPQSHIEFGNIAHRILELASSDQQFRPELLNQLADEHFLSGTYQAQLESVWRAEFQPLIGWLQDNPHPPQIPAVTWQTNVEVPISMSLWEHPELGEFKVTGRIDRIDQSLPNHTNEQPSSNVPLGEASAASASNDDADNSDAHTTVIVDYKTGTSLPTIGQIENGYNSQMPLYVAMLRASDYGNRNTNAPEQYNQHIIAYYVHLPRKRDHGAWTIVAPKKCDSTDEFYDQQLWGANKLVSYLKSYDDPNQGYIARRAMFRKSDQSDYDQLSRFREWKDSDN